MDKQIQFFGKTESGIFCQSLFAGAFEKTAGAPAFADWETGDQLRNYIRTITAADRAKYCFVLVNALGAGEYFGSNINADYFPWNALSHEGDDYGYKTFLKAHAYQHHKNKDPERAFGHPVLSVLNTGMKRVELIIRLDREKARLEQADGIISRIDKGEFPDVSMGCKVPYDVCSICSQRSKTRFDYCQHMHPPEEFRGTYGPNKILPDGRKIYVVNTLPRFFDISFVFIGADKTAKVMAKLASKGDQLCMGDVCAMPRASSEVAERVQAVPAGAASLEKTASHGTPSACCDDCGDEKLARAFLGTRSVEKTSSQLKLSEIIKSVPAGTFATKSLPQLEKTEPVLPKPILDGLAEHDLGTAVSTTGMMGIVLKPQEFQRIVLSRMGEGGLADELQGRNRVFRQVGGFDDSVPVDRELLNTILAKLLAPIAQDRTGFGEPFRVRVLKLSLQKALPTPSPVAHPLLDKLSAAYNGYRRSLLTKLSQAVEVVSGDPKLREAVLGENLVSMFMKTASAPLMSLDSVSYFMGAHFTERGLLSNTPVAWASGVEDWLP